MAATTSAVTISPAAGRPPHDPVDLRCLPVRAAHRHTAVVPVHEDFDPGTHQRVTGRLRDPVLEHRQLVDPLPHDVAVDGAAHRRRRRAVLGAEGEQAGPVEPGGIEEGEQCLVVLLGLAGKADDERRPEGGGRLPAPDGPDHLEEAVAAPPPAHALEQRLGGVLEGEVEVRHRRRQVEDGAHQRIADLGRVEVEQPHPGQALGRQGVEGVQQRRQRAG